MVRSHRDRQLEMLGTLNQVCLSCTICELGRKEAEKDFVKRDPHVLSNMNPARCIVVGQNPGWNELEKKEPFIGAAGANFDVEITKHGLSREDFYISNIVKCWTANNARPRVRHISACESFLKFEVSIIKPKLIVALGAVAYESLCPGHPFTASFGRIRNGPFGRVYPIYHPSPVNLCDMSRKKVFRNQIRLLCAMIKSGFQAKDSNKDEI